MLILVYEKCGSDARIIEENFVGEKAAFGRSACTDQHNGAVTGDLF
jgi:hypothetical protein